MQFLCTGSSFLHIMRTYNVCFCKNELRFMPLTIFHLNILYYCWWWKWQEKTFYFICEKSDQSIVVPYMFLNSYKHCYDIKSIGNFDFPRKILLYKGLYFRPVLFLPFYTQTISFRLNQRGENKTGSNISCRISKDALFPQSKLALIL